MADVIKPVFVLFIILICDVACDCTLSLNNDLGSPSPVFIRDGNFLAPDVDTGDISFRRSETVLIACTGPRKNMIMFGNKTSSYNILEAHCIINSTFRVDRHILQFKDIRCSSQPFFTTEKLSTSCAGGNQQYRVGYKVRRVFYTLYTACFDNNLLHTRYVQHTLLPTSFYMQKKVKKNPKFLEGSLFGNLQMSAVYELENQKARLNAILGDKMADNFLIRCQALTRGHLAARADYTTTAEARATYHYVNSAPQWRRGNAGDWAALEEALRLRVKTLGYDVTVYTGTHGVMTLPNSEGHSRDIYLYVDENNNHLVPVPMYYYKLVYDHRKKTAAAFISINSSFYDNATTSLLQFCDDVCDENRQYSWLKWRTNDRTHSFCCDYQQFANEIDYLPKLDVKGLFY